MARKRRRSVDRPDPKLVQRRVAQTAVTASSARSMGPRGTIGAARSFFADVDLRTLAVTDEKQFRKELNRMTNGCLAIMSPSAQYFGAARKWTNIFLRGVVYNRYLCRRYRLGHIVEWLEVPLDGDVAEALADEKGGDKLPEWDTVIRLDAWDSRRYQNFASKIAAAQRTKRVHLDLIYWRRPKKSQRTGFEEIDDIRRRAGVYEIHTLAGMPLKIGIAGDLYRRLCQHRDSYQSRLVLERGGSWRYPEDVSSKGSILAKHLYFDRALTADYDLTREAGRRKFLAKECQIFIRYTRNIKSARKIERDREKSGMFRYTGWVVLRHKPRNSGSGRR